MTKTILITGSTDGIGLEAAKSFAAGGHKVLLHGRSQDKLDRAVEQVQAIGGAEIVRSYRADLSQFADTVALAEAVAGDHDSLDVLINNAGVFNTPQPILETGLDVRFMVNTIAPYILTNRLLPWLGQAGRVINLSSAAQAPVDPDAFLGKALLDPGTAYAQSKLAITMWSVHLAKALVDGPAIIAVNPGSFLGTKMVKEAYGSDGKDISIGVDVLKQAAMGDEFADASGRYFDNDSGRFANPHPDALDDTKNAQLVALMNATINGRG